MSTFIRVSRFLLILVFFSGVSFSYAAAQPSGRLIVIGAANFAGWPNRWKRCPGSALRSFDPSRPTCVDCFSRAKRRVASANLDHCEHPAGGEPTFLPLYGTPTTCIFDR